MSDLAVTHLRNLRAQGLSYSEAHRSVGDQERLALGAYGRTIGLERDDKYRLRVAAVLQRLDGVAASHVSAAALLGLPLRASDTESVHVSPLASRRGKPKRGASHLFHSLPVTDDDLWRADGLLATTALRTVLDCARTIPDDWAVVIADAALHAGMLQFESLVDRAARIRRLHGAERARLLPDRCSPLAESPGETLLRLRLGRMGIAVDEQVSLPHVEGNPRVDFLIDGWLVIEFDGRGKYGIDGDPAGAHWAEKVRNDRLAEAGYTVLHITWQALWDEPALRRRIERARRRGPRP